MSDNDGIWVHGVKPKNREGDQPLPTTSENSKDVQQELIKMIQERREIGIQRYGSPLLTHNGRDALQDALEEAVDLSAYLMQLTMEIEDSRKEEADRKKERISFQYLLKFVSENFQVKYGYQGIVTELHCKQHGFLVNYPREKLTLEDPRVMSQIGLHMDLHDHDEYKAYHKQ